MGCHSLLNDTHTYVYVLHITSIYIKNYDSCRCSDFDMQREVGIHYVLHFTYMERAFRVNIIGIAKVYMQL